MGEVLKAEGKPMEGSLTLRGNLKWEKRGGVVYLGGYPKKGSQGSIHQEHGGNGQVSPQEQTQTIG